MAQPRVEALTKPGALRPGGRVALLYHPKVAASRHLAAALAQRLEGLGFPSATVSAWDETAVAGLSAEDLTVAVTLGGDGIMLRAARLLAPKGVYLLGVNFGRLGYLAEVQPQDALETVPAILQGAPEVEERLMLRCTATTAGGDVGPSLALNDVFVGRGRAVRAVRLHVMIDGVTMRRFAADGLIVATPTGSTAYSLSAGGPVVHPALRVLVLTPLVAHPSLVPPLVVPEDAVVEVEADTDDEIILSVDGQVHHVLASGDLVRVTAAEVPARFLRVADNSARYAALVRRLAGA